MSTLEQTTSPAAPLVTTDDEFLVSVVIPCLNEEDNIEACVRSAIGAMASAGVHGEVVVADNASEDRSAALATAAGARVVHEPLGERAIPALRAAHRPRVQAVVGQADAHRAQSPTSRGAVAATAVRAILDVP